MSADGISYLWAIERKGRYTTAPFGHYEGLIHGGTRIASGEKSRMTQQGVATTVVEDLTGLKKLIPDEHVRECGNIFGPRDAAQWRQLDKAAFEFFRIRSKVAHTLA
jgi:hypothetical protein